MEKEVKHHTLYIHGCLISAHSLISSVHWQRLIFQFSHTTHSVKALFAIMDGGRRKRMQKPMAETVLENRQVSRAGSDLPTDILELIFSKLNLKDNICASAVCKNWLTVATSLREPINAPWLMSFPKSGEFYQFYNPSNRKMYYVEYPELCGSRICYAKDSWLLAFKPRTRRVFFFQPYTRDLIKLPKPQLVLENVAFSAAPTSSNCVLFSMKNINSTVVSISTCRPGATTWTTINFQYYPPFVINIWSKVVFCKGIFYCLSFHGLLGLFYPEKHKWIIRYVSPPACMKDMSIDHWREKFMVEHDGEIFLICTHAESIPFIYKLNESARFWQEIGSLRSMTLFANSLSSAAMSDTHGRMRNHVFFSKVEFYGKRCVTYSPASRRYYPRKRYHDWGREEDAFESIWIDPPQDIATVLQG